MSINLASVYFCNKHNPACMHSKCMFCHLHIMTPKVRFLTEITTEITSQIKS